jgi:MFS family permease
VPASRDLRLLIGAVGLSSLGDRVALVPLALLVEQRGGTGVAVAALFVAMWSPAALLAGPAGLLADKVSPRTLLTVSSLAAAALCAGLAATDGLAPILVLVALMGCLNAVAMPAEFALLPLVAGDRDLVRANGWVEFARYAGFILGPAAGGLLAAAGGTSGALLANAGTFVVLAAVAAAMRIEWAPHVHHARERMRDGIDFLARDRELAPVVGIVFVSLLLMTATPAAAVFFAQEDLAMGPEGFGILMSVWGAGMAVGALVVAPRFSRGAMATMAVAAVGAQGLGIMVPALWPLVWLAIAGYLFGGVSHGAKNVLARTLIHHRAPERLRGRAFAAFNGLRNGAELVALTLGGLAIAALGARWTLVYAGGVPLLAAGAGLLWMRLRGSSRGVAPERPVAGAVRRGRRPAGIPLGFQVVEDEA